MFFQNNVDEIFFERILKKGSGQRRASAMKYYFYHEISLLSNSLSNLLLRVGI